MNINKQLPVITNKHGHLGSLSLKSLSGQVLRVDYFTGKRPRAFINNVRFIGNLPRVYHKMAMIALTLGWIK